MTKTAQETANRLGEYFSSVFTDEPPGRWNLPTSSYPSINQNTDFSQEIISKYLKELDTEKSPGPDLIPPRVLYEVRERISTALSIIFKASLDEGVVPSDWKQADISAIFKKGDKQSAGNYRPVSLTSICCKIMEKIIREKIITHLTEHDVLTHQQYGFMNGRSTLLQLVKVLDSWTDSLDRGLEVDTVFLDFRKAFDTVPHKRLLDKLKHYGINGQILNWTKSFLTGRQQRVKLRGTASEWSQVTSGIPQGSVLGPTLFIIFINSLPNNIKSQIFLFADDAKIFREIVTPQDHNILQEDLNKLHDWTNNSLLKFNANKCAMMTLSRHSDTTTDRTYTLDDATLKRTNCEKDLGVTTDCNLTFDQHIRDKVKKANSIIGLIRRTYTYLDAPTFLLLYKSLVRPHLEYCTPVWKPHHKKYIKLIETVQRRATKQIPGFRHLTYEERLTRLKLPTLQYRRDRGDMIETYKILTAKYDNRVTEGLIQLNDRETRGHDLKIKYQHSTINLRKYSFTLRTATNWNNLPQETVAANTTKEFERRLDQFWRNIPRHNPYVCAQEG